MVPGALKSNQLQQAMLLMMAGAGMMGGMSTFLKKPNNQPIAKPKSKKYNANHPA